MPDLTMCQGNNCKMRDSCYRYTAMPNPWRQMYFMSSPFDSLIGKCEYYNLDTRTEAEKQRDKYWYDEDVKNMEKNQIEVPKK